MPAIHIPNIADLTGWYNPKDYGAKLDSNLATGGGTDDTAVIQSILDRAASGQPVKLLMNGPALVSGLNVYGNTIIYCMEGAGFYLKDNSNRAIVRNVHRSKTTRTDQNIAIIGGYYNGNRSNQTGVGSPAVYESDGTPMVGLQFYGVQNLKIEHVKVVNTLSWLTSFANIAHADLSDIDVDSQGQPANITVDGINIQGPSQYIHIRGVKVGSWDDAIAINTLGTAHIGDLGPYVAPGDVTDVIIDGVELMGSLMGLRLFSTDYRIDRIIASNFAGSAHAYAGVLDYFDVPYGNFGSITLENFDVALLTQSVPGGNISPAYLNFNGIFESLTLRNIKANNLIDTRPLLWFHSNCDIDQLTLDGFDIYDSLSAAVGALPIKLEGRIRRFVARGCNWFRDSALARASEWLKFIGSAARIDELILNQVCVNRSSYVINQNSGQLDCVQAANLRHTDTNNGSAFRAGNGEVIDMVVSNFYGANVVSTTGSGSVTTKHGDAFPVDAIPPALSTLEVGNVDAYTVVATFTEAIQSANYATGITIKNGGVTQTIVSATRQLNHAVIHYVLQDPFVYGDTGTLDYDSGSGDLSDVAGNALATISADPITNNVASSATFEDTFAPDAGSINGRTPAPVSAGGNWSLVSGSISLSGGRAVAFVGAAAEVEGGESDGTISAIGQINLGGGVGVEFRLTDDNNKWLVILYAGFLQLFKRVSGSYIHIDGKASDHTPGVDYNVTITLSGSNISVTDGSEIISTSDSFNSTATGIGVYFESNGGEIGDLVTQ